MKIGLLIDDSLDFPDGVQQYTLTLGAWLQREGHEVHYITSTTKNTSISQLHVLTKYLAVRFNKNSMRTPLPCRKKVIKKFYNHTPLDVLHVQMPYSPLFAGRVIALAPEDTAVVGTFHVAPFAKKEIHSARLLQPLYKSSVLRFSRICSVSRSAQQFAENAFFLTSEVIPNGVDTKRFFSSRQKPKSADVVEIRFLGRHVPRKGCLELLHAILHYKNTYQFPDIHVTIGGKGEDTVKLQKFVAEHQLQEIVTFAGFVNEESKAEFFADADIVIFPSTGGESFGIILVEAMSTGNTVVLAGDNPGYSRVMANKEVLFDPRNTVELSQMLHKYASNPRLRQLTAEKQQKQAAQYDISVVGSKILDMYESAIKENYSRQ